MSCWPSGGCRCRSTTAPQGTTVATVAVCDEPDRERERFIADRLGVNRIRFLATTDWDVEQADPGRLQR